MRNLSDGAFEMLQEAVNGMKVAYDNLPDEYKGLLAYSLGQLEGIVLGLSWQKGGEKNERKYESP